jgi:hypothetical protein
MCGILLFLLYREIYIKKTTYINLYENNQETFKKEKN